MDDRGVQGCPSNPDVLEGAVEGGSGTRVDGRGHQRAGPRLPAELIALVVHHVRIGDLPPNDGVAGPDMLALRLVNRAVKQMADWSDPIVAHDIVHNLIAATPPPAQVLKDLQDGTALPSVRRLQVTLSVNGQNDTSCLLPSLNAALSLCTGLESLQLDAGEQWVLLDELCLGKGLEKLGTLEIMDLLVEERAWLFGPDLNFLPGLRSVTLHGVSTSGTALHGEGRFSKLLVLGLPVFLTSLTLRELVLGPDAAKALRLAERRTLTYLDLSDNPLGRAGVAHLDIGSNTSLRQLYLERTNLDDAGVAALDFGRNSTIEHLHLGYNGVTSAGVRSLHLDSNTSLSSLDVTYNAIDDPSSFFIASNKALTKLGVTFNPFRSLDFELEFNNTLSHLSLDVGYAHDGDSDLDIDQVTRFSASVSGSRSLTKLKMMFRERAAGAPAYLLAFNLAGNTSVLQLLVSDSGVLGEAAFDGIGIAQMAALEKAALGRASDALLERMRKARPDVGVECIEGGWDEEW